MTRILAAILAVIWIGSPTAAQERSAHRVELETGIGFIGGEASAGDWGFSLALGAKAHRGDFLFGIRFPVLVSPGGVDDGCDLAPSGRCLPTFVGLGGIFGELGYALPTWSTGVLPSIGAGVGAIWTDDTEGPSVSFSVQGEIAFDLTDSVGALLGPRILWVPDLESLHVLSTQVRVGFYFRPR